MSSAENIISDISTPSMIVSGGSEAPVIEAIVGKISIDDMMPVLIVPAGIFPGQRIMQGTRCPPSQVVPFMPLSDPLLPP